MLVFTLLSLLSALCCLLSCHCFCELLIPRMLVNVHSNLQSISLSLLQTSHRFAWWKLEQCRWWCQVLVGTKPCEQPQVPFSHAVLAAVIEAAADTRLQLTQHLSLPLGVRRLGHQLLHECQHWFQDAVTSSGPSQSTTQYRLVANLAAVGVARTNLASHT